MTRRDNPKDRPKDRRHFHAKDQHRPRGDMSGLWLYGMHPVMAALANPKRKIHRVVLTERAAQEIGPKLLGRAKHEIAEMQAINRILPDGAVHQGVALQVEKLPKLDLDELLSSQSEKR
ncbi:MAG: RNA methyltransferase substrate-binding domain-containing protein, partial [Rhizomicrobium sp.]